MSLGLQSSPPRAPHDQQPGGSSPPNSAPIPVPTSSEPYQVNTPYGNLSSSPYNGVASYTTGNGGLNNGFSNSPYGNGFSNGSNGTVGNSIYANGSRPSSIMLPLEESDNEPEYSPSVGETFPSRSYSPVNSNLSKKRHSALYDNVTLSSLAAAAAYGNEDMTMLAPPRPWTGNGHRKSASVSSANSSLLDSLLDTNVGKNISNSRSFANLSLEPPESTPTTLPPPQFSPAINSYNSAKRSSWYSTHSNMASPAPNGASPALPSMLLQQFPSSSPSLSGEFPDPSFLPPPIPPFAGGKSHHRPSASIGSINSIGPFSTNSSISLASNYSTTSLHQPTEAEIASLSVPSRSESPIFRAHSPGAAYQPFNFQSTTMALAQPSTSRAGPNQRRGHKYKHSSVSMNFFKEDVRVPLAIPASLPIPTLTECHQSMSRDQNIRALWGVFHLYVAFLIYIIDSPYTALSALAHLLFYDAMGAFLCAIVDILGNFEVWKRSTVHLPFGLERAEVLVGYAFSIMLIFMGGDIMSHSVQDMAQSVYLGSFFSASHGHGSVAHHHDHSDGVEHVDWNVIVFRVVLGIIVTVVSAVGFDNHARIARALRNAYNGSNALKSLPSFLSNPSHFITVTFSFLILLYPFESPLVRRICDTILTPMISMSMCYVGWSLAKSLGGMLVMSFPGENRVETVASEVAKLPHVVNVKDVAVWQVHHSVWLACMKVEMEGGNSQEESIVRSDAARLVKEIMNEGFETQYADDGLSYSDEDDSYEMDQPPTTTGKFASFFKNPFAKLKVGGSTLMEPIRWEVTIDITRTKE